jgi:hypothetical protein
MGLWAVRNRVSSGMLCAPAGSVHAIGFVESDRGGRVRLEIQRVQHQFQAAASRADQQRSALGPRHQLHSAAAEQQIQTDGQVDDDRHRGDQHPVLIVVIGQITPSQIGDLGHGCCPGYDATWKIHDTVESPEDLVVVRDRHQRGLARDIVVQDLQNVLLVRTVQIPVGSSHSSRRGAGQQGAADSDSLAFALRQAAHIAAQLVADSHLSASRTARSRTLRSSRNAG